MEPPSARCGVEGLEPPSGAVPMGPISSSGWRDYHSAGRVVRMHGMPFDMSKHASLLTTLE